MIRALIIASAALVFTACGQPSSSYCCLRVSEVGRDVAYVGSIAAPDGGAPTQVRVVVSDAGTATVTWTNDGHEISATFSTP